MLFLKARVADPPGGGHFYTGFLFHEKDFLYTNAPKELTRPLTWGFMQFGRLAIVSSTEPLLNVSEIYKSGILLTPALRLNSYYGNYKTEYGKEKSSLNS